MSESRDKPEPSSTTAAPELPSPYVQMMELTYTALVNARAIYAAAQLGVPDLLQDATGASDELARATGTDPEALYRLLRTLANAGILTESEDHRFALTPLGATLRSDAPGSMRAWVLFSGASFYLQVWQAILYSIHTGRPAWSQVHGAPLFDWLAQHPDAAAIFDQAMTSLSGGEAPAVVSAYDFSAFQTLVDVGGGQGTLLMTILEAHPALRGVLYDQPQVVAGARQPLAAQGLAERCAIVAGDFFESVPPGADAYLLKYILHDWDDEQCLLILRNCRRAMSPDGKLLIVEIIVPPPGEPHLAKVSDLEMLIVLGSRERTREQYESLLGRAGFRVVRIVPTSEPLSLIEAVRA